MRIRYLAACLSAVVLSCAAAGCGSNDPGSSSSGGGNAAGNSTGSAAADTVPNEPVRATGTFHFHSIDGYSGDAKITLHQVATLPSLRPACGDEIHGEPGQRAKAIEIDIDSTDTTTGSLASQGWHLPIQLASSYSGGFGGTGLEGIGMLCPGTQGDWKTSIPVKGTSRTTLYATWLVTPTARNPSGFTKGQDVWNDLWVWIPLAGKCTGTVSGGGYRFDSTDCGLIN